MELHVELMPYTRAIKYSKIKFKDLGFFIKLMYLVYTSLNKEV